MPFDFDAAVRAPFRMQPGLRRMGDGSTHLTPAAPGSRQQREKLAVLSSAWQRALCAAPAFDASAALQALCEHAAREHPAAWRWDGSRAAALGVEVSAAGTLAQRSQGSFGLGDEVMRCLRGLPPPWRLGGLLSLAFAEDLALIDGATGTLPWLAVALPSHWSPQEKCGLHFSAVHAPVADNALLLAAAESLLKLVTGGERWERFVWTVTDHARLNAHPAVVAPERWPDGRVDRAWWRSEHQRFLPLPALRAAWFTIGVELQPLADALPTRGHAAAVHAALSSMSPAVLTYRHLHTVREPLLAWLEARMR